MIVALKLNVLIQYIPGGLRAFEGIGHQAGKVLFIGKCLSPEDKLSRQLLVLLRDIKLQNDEFLALGKVDTADIAGRLLTGEFVFSKFEMLDPEDIIDITGASAYEIPKFKTYKAIYQQLSQFKQLTKAGG